MPFRVISLLPEIFSLKLTFFIITAVLFITRRYKSHNFIVRFLTVFNSFYQFFFLCLVSFHMQIFQFCNLRIILFFCFRYCFVICSSIEISFLGLAICYPSLFSFPSCSARILLSFPASLRTYSASMSNALSIAFCVAVTA